MFEIHRIGYKTTHKNGINICRPTGTCDYLFLCIKSKTCIVTDDNTYNITSPCVIVFDKGSIQKYYSTETPFVNDWIHFDGDDVKTLADSLQFPFNVPIMVHNVQEISNQILIMVGEYIKNGVHSREILDLTLRSMLYRLSDIYHEESKFPDKLNNYRLDFSRVRNMIYSFREDTPLTVNELAKSLNLSVSYFQHIYKQLFNVSVVQDIIKSRIDYACNLLLNNYDSISDIAGRCGYENPEHFTRQFKQHMGCTPKQYRKNMLN